MEKKLARVRIYVEGRVQGVFYRGWTRDNAIDLGLIGWVRNMGDGRVEVVVEGEKGDLAKFIELIKEGPPLAKVDHIDVIWEKAIGEFEGFEVRH